MTDRHLHAVPDPPTPVADPRDVCDRCGHLRSTHRAGGTCTAFVPGLPLKSVDRDAHPIERVTQINVTSKGKAHAKEWTSSVCSCPEFIDSGYRFIVESDPLEAKAVADGRKRRTVLPIAELS